MPRLNRSVICARDEVQVFHLINCCVRRTYLCGKDKRSGRIEDRQLATDIVSADAQDLRTEHGEKAGWLSPMALDPPRKKVRETQTTRRASNKGCLSMSLDDYLKLLDWTGRQIHKNKLGRIPEACAPILTRLKCDAATWLDFVKNFHLRFRREAGLLPSRQSFRSQLRGKRETPLAG